MEQTRALVPIAAALVLQAGAAAAAAAGSADASCAWITSFGGTDVCGILVPSGESLG